MSKRQPTKYPGVFAREGKRIGGKGTELIYYVVFKKDGQVREEKVGRQFADDMTPAKAAAVRAERIEGKRQSRKEQREAAQAAKQAEANRWTIERLWTEYKASKPGLKGIVTDENRFKNFILPAFGQKEPRQIIALDVDRLRVKLLKTHKPGTVKNVLELLRRIINYGIKKNICPGPGFVVELPRANSLKTEDLTPEEMAALLRAIEEDTHPQAGPMMKLALFSGLRKSEMLKLRWQDVDFHNGFIHLPDAKSGKDEKIPMSAPARDVLEAMPRTSEYVFPGRGGSRRVFIQRHVNAIRDRAGLPKDFRAFHGLRHVYASMLASSGQVDMYTLQKLMTHKSPAMTQRYAHLRDDALQRAAGVAGEIFAKVAGGREAHDKGKVVNLRKTEE